MTAILKTAFSKPGERHFQEQLGKFQPSLNSTSFPILQQENYGTFLLILRPEPVWQSLIHFQHLISLLFHSRSVLKPIFTKILALKLNMIFVRLFMITLMAGKIWLHR